MAPLIGWHTGKHVEEERNGQVGRHHVDPDAERQGGQEREEVWILFDRFCVQDGDAEVHERHREVDTLKK